MPIMSHHGVNDDDTDEDDDGDDTFGRCNALPLIFFGAPSVSKEWLRTRMALYTDIFRKKTHHYMTSYSASLGKYIYLKIFNESYTPL